MSVKTKDPRFDTAEYQDFYLLECPVKWARLIEPDRPEWNKDGLWKLDAVLNAKQAKECKKYGFATKLDKDGDTVITCKRKCKTNTGKSMSPPVVIDKARAPFSMLIGNGTVCNIHLRTKYVKGGAKTYLPAYLEKVQVVNHIIYEGSTRGSDEFPEYSVPAAAGSDSF